MRDNRKTKILCALAAILVLAGTGQALAGGFPTLDKIKSGSSRFKPVLGGLAQLDKETGLVWETTPNSDYRNWPEAVDHCYGRIVGSRLGWRLPTVDELYTLFEATGSGSLDLPMGHPFQLPPGDDSALTFWSMTQHASESSSRYAVAWYTPLRGHLSSVGVAFGAVAWCVRGGDGHNPSVAP